MGVAQLYYHIAPRNEFGIIVKPLIRLLKGHVEIQSVVLSNIATISADRSVSLSWPECVQLYMCVVDHSLSLSPFASFSHLSSPSLSSSPLLFPPLLGDV